jgi:hypothetical protein
VRERELSEARRAAMLGGLFVFFVVNGVSFFLAPITTWHQWGAALVALAAGLVAVLVSWPDDEG